MGQGQWKLRSHASDSASEAACPATSTLSDFSALQQAAPTESTENRHVAQRISLSQERGEKAGDQRDHLDQSEHGGDREDPLDHSQTPATEQGFSKEVEERSRQRSSQPEGLHKAASLLEDQPLGRCCEVRSHPAPRGAHQRFCSLKRSWRSNPRPSLRNTSISVT